MGVFDLSLNLNDDRVDPSADFTLCFFRRRLEPEFVNLSGDAVLAGHPAIAKILPVGLGDDGCRFLIERRDQVACRGIDCGCREVRQFWYGVGPRWTILLCELPH